MIRFSVLCMTTLSLLFISNASVQAETLALVCKNLNRNNTTPITVDLTASTVSWGGIFAAHITPASIDWTDSTHQAVNHIERSTGFFTETIQGKYVEQWECRKAGSGGF